jgi:hypothetical protein
VQVGGALGLAVLATAAASRTHALGTGDAALVGGFHLAFAIAAGLAVAAIVVALALLRPQATQQRESAQAALPETA